MSLNLWISLYLFRSKIRRFKCCS